MDFIFTMCPVGFGTLWCRHTEAWWQWPVQAAVWLVMTLPAVMIGMPVTLWLSMPQTATVHMDSSIMWRTLAVSNDATIVGTTVSKEPGFSCPDPILWCCGEVRKILKTPDKLLCSLLHTDLANDKFHEGKKYPSFCQSKTQQSPWLPGWIIDRTLNWSCFHNSNWEDKTY